MTTWVFPGQGSQAKGMGAELFDRYADLTAKADAASTTPATDVTAGAPVGPLNIEW